MNWKWECKNIWLNCHQFLFSSGYLADDISAKGTTFTNTSMSLRPVTDTYKEKKRFFKSYTSAETAFFISVAKCLSWKFTHSQSIIRHCNERLRYKREAEKRFGSPDLNLLFLCLEETVSETNCVQVESYIKSPLNHWLGTVEKVCLDSQGCACHYQMYLRMMFRYRRIK